MPQIIPVDGSLADIDQFVELDGQAYRFEFRWSKRSNRWHVSVENENGANIVSSRALQAGTLPLRGHKPSEAPDGIVLIDGPDDYRKENLGEDLQLVYFQASEIDVLDVEDDLSIFSRIKHASALVVATGSGMAVGHKIKHATATANGIGSASATGHKIKHATATTSGAGSASGTGHKIKHGTATAGGAGSASGTGRLMPSADALGTLTSEVDETGVTVS